MFKFYPRPFLVRSEWSGVQTVTRVGNLQFIKQFQHYVAAKQPTRYRWIKSCAWPPHIHFDEKFDSIPMMKSKLIFEFGDQLPETDDFGVSYLSESNLLSTGL